MELDYTTPRKNFIDFVKKSNIVTELFNKLTCKNRLNNGTWRLLIVSSIPFTLFFILPGVLFWIVVHLALWVSDSYKDSERDRIADTELFNKLTCKNRLNNGTWRLLIVSSIPFTLFFILPGVLFWIVVHLALWVSDGYKDSGRDRIAEREIKKKTSINNFDDDAPF